MNRNTLACKQKTPMLAHRGNDNGHFFEGEQSIANRNPSLKTWTNNSASTSTPPTPLIPSGLNGVPMFFCSIKVIKKTMSGNASIGYFFSFTPNKDSKK